MFTYIVMNVNLDTSDSVVSCYLRLIYLFIKEYFHDIYNVGIQLDVPSSYYHSVNSEESDQANVHTASHSNEQQDGKELFPYDTPADLNTTATLSSIRETTDGVMYSLAGEPLEGEVCDINVAYSVHTRSSYSSVAADGYESLSNVQ